MSDDNKAVIRRIYDKVFNQDRWDLISECYCDDLCGHDPANGSDIVGCQALEDLLKTYREAYPDHRYEVHEVIGEGEFVAVRWTVHVPFQKSDIKVDMEGISLCRFRDGKVAEVWQHYDNLALLSALGVVEKIDVPTAVARASGLA